ncbi:MAG: hypothetical protein GTO02_15275 [Candidatus Dadabacteria bacterium]|nr:hypothetical protein [Candidatus Dadabacteria bacterium]NIQ15702.1 hypothetical protein [Candidatus Dadabacteria bacterium]
MRFLKYFLLALIIAIPFNVYSGDPYIQSRVSITQTDKPDEEVFAYYDLRNRKTYVQVTNVETEDGDALPNVCLHIQIYQQDRGCSELNFEDELTPNDTVIYDMDNLVRNDGSAVPVNLDDDSYGFVAISAFDCTDRDENDLSDPLLGNVRIIDDAGYEYRMNLFTDRSSEKLTILQNSATPDSAEGNIIIPFNTVDGSMYADVVGFLIEDDRNLAGSDQGATEDLVYNEETGITFSVFQVDENEERLSCDQKTFACGPGKVMNYGINEDIKASRGNNLLCEGASLTPGQTHGYISLENATALSPLDAVESPPNIGLEFICMVGLNNNDGTGSMDACQVECIDGPPTCDDD